MKLVLEITDLLEKKDLNFKILGQSNFANNIGWNDFYNIGQPIVFTKNMLIIKKIFVKP